MTIFDMLGQSSVLTVLGMGIVFGFLVIMVLCVSIMGKIFSALGKKNDAGDALKSSVVTAVLTATTSAATTAAISAAVHQYRQDSKE